ncbi:MAG TPA: hypothetical protein VIA62_11805 [Thermoanaerobaculia bacterium]|jgi:hypothetical protein|nr:hypothetical protein [Thermoanaerobaculia bacterium]
MDAKTVAERSRLGLTTFNILHEKRLFGFLKRGVAAADTGTEIFGLEDGEPVFVRFPLLGEAGGYVDLALQEWLGDPVVAVVPNVRWDPEGFQAQASALGYKWRRWVSYTADEVALECGNVFLDPYRGRKGQPYVVPPREVRKEWGLPPEQLADNKRRYEAYVAAVAATNGAGGLAVTRFTTSQGSLDLCSVGSVPGGAYHCVPEIAQGGDLWCVPAVLEMIIEFFLPPKKGGEGMYQGKLASDLGLYGGAALKDWQKIPPAVSDVSAKVILTALIAVEWGSVVTEIDARRPLGYLTDDHAFLVFGYSGVVAWTSVPPSAYLRVLNPWGLKEEHLSFSCLPSGSLLKFWQVGHTIQSWAMKMRRWARHFIRLRS